MMERGRESSAWRQPLSVAAFVLVFVALLALAPGPGQWRLASRTSSLPASCCWHPERGQAVRRLRLPSSRAFTLVAFGNNGRPHPAGRNPLRGRGRLGLAKSARSKPNTTARGPIDGAGSRRSAATIPEAMRWRHLGLPTGQLTVGIEYQPFAHEHVALARALGRRFESYRRSHSHDQIGQSRPLWPGAPRPRVD